MIHKFISMIKTFLVCQLDQKCILTFFNEHFVSKNVFVDSNLAVGIGISEYHEKLKASLSVFFTEMPYFSRHRNKNWVIFYPCPTNTCWRKENRCLKIQMYLLGRRLLFIHEYLWTTSFWSVWGTELADDIIYTQAFTIEFSGLA